MYISIVIILSIQALALVQALQNNTLITTLTENESFSNGAEGEGNGGLVLNVPSSIAPNDSPENAFDIVQKARRNEFSAEMITNRTRAQVLCETGEILVKINFTEPFHGVAYADFNRQSPCRLFGEGGQYYEMKLPLKGCGTKQEAPRLFVNNLVLRFHRSLELEEDEVKTIVCRYPPPQAPPPPAPPGLPARVVQVPPEPAKLTQYEPFVIIAGLLFFALLLAGIGTTSYVTRKQVITPINTPLPITSKTAYDNYIDNQSIITTEDIITTQKLAPLPKYSTHTVDDVFITNIHEIDTVEDLVHHKRVIPKAHLQQLNYDDTYLTNQHEITSEENLVNQTQRNQVDVKSLYYDDAYITNQNETIENENLTHQKLTMPKPKIEVRTIEDTYITNVDEILDTEIITQMRNNDIDAIECRRPTDDYYAIERHR